MADVYISPGGSDGGGLGTEASPWQTISKAVTSSASGDTIHCAAGTYTWVSQTFASPRTVVGAGASTTIFDGAGAAVSWQGADTLNVSDITFIDAAQSGFANIIGNGGVATVTVTNCIFKDLTAGARALFGKNITGTAGGTFAMIGCSISNCSKAGGDGYFGTHNAAFSFVVYNCTIYSNVADAVTLSFYSMAEGGSPTINFDLRNLIVMNENGTNRAWHTAGTATVNTYTGTVAASNIIFGYTSLPAGLSGALTSNPLFVDAATSNFNLRPGSPAIDAGVLI